MAERLPDLLSARLGLAEVQLKDRIFHEIRKSVMEPKKEYSEDEENGERVTRTRDYDPETKTQIEEVKIERVEEEPDKEQ
jgi:hypothetical protein